jgi:phosphoribosyl 1,2-cyclic phosphodiesterase
MSLTFCSFSSGSSGNCSLVKSKKTAVLVDAGISTYRILQSLGYVGTGLGDVSALLITHEHTDHIRSIRAVNRKLPHITTYANIGTWKHIENLVDEKQRSVFKTGEAFTIADMEIKPFRLSHDATEPVGYSFRSGGKQISIITDTGFLNEEILDEIIDADLLAIEANHDTEMLKMGRYPYFLKRRILGEKGHLSNVDAASVICRLLSQKDKFRQVLLAHLSRENNFPEMAYQTVKNLLEEKNFYIGKHLRLNIIARDEMSAVYIV